ncbi:MAG: MFS transporter [Halobacteriales archaeon]
MARLGDRLLASVRSLRGDGRGWVLLAVAGGWFLSLGVRLIFPAILPQIRTAFGFDLTTAGTLLTGLWLAYAIGQFPGGILGDRFGERAVLVGSTAIATVMVVLLVVAPGATAFFVATILFGLGTGLYATTRFTVISDVFPDRDGTALGFTSSAGNLGATALPVLAGVLAVGFGWRAGFAVLVPGFLIVLVALRRFIPARTSGTTSAVDSISKATVRRILSGITRRSVLVGATAMLLMSIIYQGFTGFYPTYLVQMKGISESTAATVFGLFFGAGILIQPIAGAIGDRIGHKWALVGFSIGTAVGMALLPVVPGLGGVLVVTGLASLQLGFWPVAQSFVIDGLPDDIQGSGFGLLRTIYLIIAAGAPAAIGALGDAGFFDEAFLLLAAIAVLTAGLFLVVQTD